MSRIPFTVYDFFAYLASGGLLVASVDAVFGYQWLLAEDIGVGRGLILLLVAYIVGHVVADISSVLLEHGFVGKVLKRPSATLMGARPPTWTGWAFPGYYRALPTSTQERIRIRAKAVGVEADGEGLFLHAYGTVTRSADVQARLDEFRNLYGFARNMTFALVGSGGILALGTALADFPDSYGWAAISVALGIAMLYRYLKFFRQFSYQLFVTYAEVPTDNSGG